VQHFTESPRKLAHTKDNTTAENEETRAHEADCSEEPKDKRKHKLTRSAAPRLLVRIFRVSVSLEVVRKVTHVIRSTLEENLTSS